MTNLTTYLNLDVEDLGLYGVSEKLLWIADKLPL